MQRSSADDGDETDDQEAQAVSSEDRKDPGKDKPVEHFDHRSAEDELVQLFLRQPDPEPQKRAICIALYIFLFLFVVKFSDALSDPIEEAEILVPIMEDYIPPLEKPPPPKVIEKQQVKKVALPDPTPDEPEPIIEPPPEPEPPPLPANVVIRRGRPRGPPSKGGPVREGTAGLVNPQRIAKFYKKPEYPSIAQRANFGGTVVLRAVIDKEGNVTKVQLLKGLERFNLDENAIEAVKKWKYTPGLLEGKPVEVIMTIRVVYTIS